MTRSPSKCKQRIAVDGAVLVPVDEWNQIVSSYHRMRVALINLANHFGHEGKPVMKEARAAIKEARSE